MNKNTWKILRGVLYGAFVLVFAWVTVQLFFVDALSSHGEENEEMRESDELIVMYPSEIASLEPTQFNPDARQRLVNIFEPLVRADADLNMQPALAISWGLVDDVTWEFRLRPDVKFHDGSNFDVEDVLRSFERAAKYERSELRDLLSTVKSLKAVDAGTFRIETKKPDPLLLQKVSSVLIMTSDMAVMKLDKIVGTGPYKYASWKPNEQIELLRNDAYWGEMPAFKKVVMKNEADKSKRVNAFLKGEADMLAFVPFDTVDVVRKQNFEIKTVPSLEVQFLLFNFESENLSDFEARKFLASSLNKYELTAELGDFALPVGQFVSNGVFGFNPAIDSEFDEVKDSLKGSTLQFHLLKGQDVLGEFVRKSLGAKGVNVIVSYLDGLNFLKSLDEKKADMYFFGFKSDLGDSVDFFKSIVKSEADFNVMNYVSEEADKLIVSGLTELDERRRRDDLQELMEIVVKRDVIGLPLFEYETVFALNDSVEFEPRIDGMIYFDEITVK